MGMILAVMMVTLAFTGCTQGTKAPAKAKDVTIEYWDMNYGDATVWEAGLKKMAGDFTADTGVKVDITILGWDNFMQNYLTAIESNATSDIFTSGFGQNNLYAQMGAVLPIDDIINEYKKNGTFDDFVVPMNSLMYDGKYIAVPHGVFPTSMIYREDMLKAVGYDKAPETWDDFLDCLRALKTKYNFPPLAFSTADAQGNHFMLTALLQNGTGVFNDKMECQLETPAALEAYEYVYTLYNEGLIPKGTASYLRSDAEKAYLSGNAAMSFGSHSPNSAINKSDLASKSGAMVGLYGPSKADKKPGNLTWFNAMSIFSSTKYPDECKDFIRFMQDNNIRLYTECGQEGVPTRKSQMQAFKDFYKNDALTIKWSALADYSLSPSAPATSTYPEFTQIDGQNLLSQVAAIIFTGTASDPKEIGKLATDIVMKNVSFQKK